MGLRGFRASERRPVKEGARSLRVDSREEVDPPAAHPCLAPRPCTTSQRVLGAAGTETNKKVIETTARNSSRREAGCQGGDAGGGCVHLRKAFARGSVTVLIKFVWVDSGTTFFFIECLRFGVGTKVAAVTVSARDRGAG